MCSCMSFCYFSSETIIDGTCWQVAVHLDCYRKFKDPVGPWKCELCEEMPQSGSPRNQTVENRDRSCLVVECGLCGGGYGAFRKATNGQWVHAFCAEVSKYIHPFLCNVCCFLSAWS